MNTTAYYRTILKAYPETISKEQMRIICAISKKTCHYLLTSGLVPCQDTGKQTHRFRIKTTDVIQYLKDREVNPEKYRPPKGYYGRNPEKCSNATGVPYFPIDGKTVALMRSYFAKALKDYPDVLLTEQVAEFTGYGVNSVNGWCSKQKLKHFRICGRFYIPKEYLLDYLVSDQFIKINRKSEKHIQFIYAIWDRIGNKRKKRKQSNR